MPYYSYPARLANQNQIPIELWCQWAHLALIMSLTSMKILTNVDICNTILDTATLQLSAKFGESKWNPYWVIMLTSLSGSVYAPNEHEMLTNVAHMQYHLR